MPSHSASHTSRTDWSGAITALTVTLASVAGAVLSFSGLQSLGRACGYPGHVAWLFPVAVDAAALLAWQVWLTTGRDFARRVGYAATAVSALGNATSHLLADDDRWLLTSIVGAVPAVIVPLVMHLMTTEPVTAARPEPCDVTADWPMWEREAQAWVPEPEPPAAPEPVAVLAITAAAEEDADERFAAVWDVPLDLLRRCRAAGVTSVRSIRSTFTLTEDEARRANKALRHVEPPAPRNATLAREAVTA